MLFLSEYFANILNEWSQNVELFSLLQNASSFSISYLKKNLYYNWKIIGKVSISRSLTTNVRLNENVGIIKIYYSSDNKEPISDVSRLFEGPVYRFGCPKDIFQVSFFQFYFNKKHVKVAINDFTMHLIILEWLGMEK